MRAALATFAVLAVALPATASAADVPPGAAWSQASIPSTGGVSLHADGAGVRARRDGAELAG